KRGGWVAFSRWGTAPPETGRLAVSLTGVSDTGRPPADLRLSSLVRHRGGGFSGRVRVEVAARDGPQIRVEVVPQRHSRGDVQRRDVVVRDVVEVFHQGAQ